MPAPAPDLRPGLALQQAGKLAEARLCYERILRDDPENTQVLHLLALVHLASGRPEEAIVLLVQCLILRPELAEAHGNLGNALKALHRTEEALAAYRRGRELRSDSADLEYNEALVHLLRGDLGRGWAGYERRWDRKQSAGRRPFALPTWDGRASLEGKGLLIHAEQGLGDSLQFARYLPLLVARGARVHLEVQTSLRAFLAAQWPGVAVGREGGPLPKFDCQCALLSLPGAFATTLDSIPSPGAYFRAPAEKAAQWRERWAGRPGPKIGLAWAGRAVHQNDRHRSIPLAAFASLWRGFSADFFSLQKELRPGDAALLAGPDGPVDLAGQLQDFTDTAAIVANLDLVITVDTAVAHLAGALGIRTWLLLPFAPDWRWLLDRADSPWYASLRLFRQPAPGDWASVLREVRSQLATPLPGGAH